VARLTRLALAAALLLALPVPVAAALPKPVADALRDAAVPVAAVAVVVQEVGAPRPALSLNARVPMNPASTMKLFTTLAALELLGPAYRWKTEAYAAGELRDGVLDGDLVLKGYGDPKLDYESFWLLLRQLRGEGLREIRGDVVLDRSFFAPVAGAPGDFDELYLTFPSEGVLVHTNHFLSPRFSGRDVSLWVMPDSPFRLARIATAVAAPGALSLDTFRLALADHANHPSGVCCHPDPRSARLDQGTTVASVLMDLDTKTMWVADGHPCTTPYRELDYASFLSKPASVAAG